MPTHILHLGSASCPIHIHPNLLTDAPAILKSLGCFTRVFIVADSSLLTTHAQSLASALTRANITPHIHSITAEESLKTLPTASSLINFLLSHRCSRARPPHRARRRPPLRSRRLHRLHLPPRHQPPPRPHHPPRNGRRRHRRKNRAQLSPPHQRPRQNFLGTFYPPLAILADPNTLSTLPPRVFRAGLAECVKHSLLADPAHFLWLNHNASKILNHIPETLSHLISTSIAIKSAIVENDPLERASRAHLNLGHTFAHVIETIPQLNLSHGEAVSIGLCAAAELSRLTANLNSSLITSLHQLLNSFDLPTRLPMPIPISNLLPNMLHDKKSSHAHPRFILLHDLAQPFISDNVSPDHLRSAWLSVGASE